MPNIYIYLVKPAATYWHTNGSSFQLNDHWKTQFESLRLGKHVFLQIDEPQLSVESSGSTPLVKFLLPISVYTYRKFDTSDKLVFFLLLLFIYKCNRRTNGVNSVFE